MNGLVNYLLSEGYAYQEYRKVVGYVAVAKPSGYYFRLVKGENQFSFGLNEKGHPPGLIFPRPVINYADLKTNCYSTSINDRAMERLVAAYPARAVIEAILTQRVLCLPLSCLDSLLIPVTASQT